MRLTSLLLQASNPARFQCVKSQKNPYHRHLERLVCAKKIDQKVFLSQLYPRDVLGTLERKPGGTSDSSGCSSCDCSECRERGDVCDTCSMYNQSSNPPSVRYWSKFEMLKL